MCLEKIFLQTSKIDDLKKELEKYIKENSHVIIDRILNREFFPIVPRYASFIEILELPFNFKMNDFDIVPNGMPRNNVTRLRIIRRNNSDGGPRVINRKAYVILIMDSTTGQCGFQLLPKPEDWSASLSDFINSSHISPLYSGLPKTWKGHIISRDIPFRVLVIPELRGVDLSEFGRASYKKGCCVLTDPKLKISKKLSQRFIDMKPLIDFIKISARRKLPNPIELQKDTNYRDHCKKLLEEINMRQVSWLGSHPTTEVVKKMYDIDMNSIDILSLLEAKTGNNSGKVTKIFRLPGSGQFVSWDCHSYTWHYFDYVNILDLKFFKNEFLPFSIPKPEAVRAVESRQIKTLTEKELFKKNNILSIIICGQEFPINCASDLLSVDIKRHILSITNIKYSTIDELINICQDNKIEAVLYFIDEY